jgi:hypothetical protein
LQTIPFCVFCLLRRSQVKEWEANLGRWRALAETAGGAGDSDGICMGAAAAEQDD